MKNYFILVLLTFSTLIFAQIENFSINQGNVSWQKVYETNVDIPSALKSNYKLKINGETKNELTGTVENLLMDYKGAGYALLSASNYANHKTLYDFDFKIDLKEDRYRVTVFNIKMKGSYVADFLGTASKGGTDESTIEVFTLRNNKTDFLGTFVNKGSKIIDYTFSEFFDVSKYAKKDDNW